MLPLLSVCPVEEVLTAGNLRADWQAGTTVLPLEDFFLIRTRIFSYTSHRFTVQSIGDFPSDFPFNKCFITKEIYIEIYIDIYSYIYKYI